MRTTSVDLHTLTGAYAVNALSDTERTAFETHLARCESCATEVAELAATATRLGAAVDFPPPPHLRARVLAAAAETRQLSPHTPRLPRARGWGRAGGLLAAACLVAVAFVAVQGTQSDRDQLAQLSSQYSRFSDLLSTPDARLVNASGPNGSTATAVVSASRNELLFVSKDMPAPPADHVYQLWLIDSDGPHSAGLLAPPSAPLVATGLSNARKVAITVEPQGGSQVPTGDALMEIPLA
ncbi:anti-sigma factor domain-containing protein [Lentzea rhizosphaerae]|uniref:Regulator of SigK n=1 Tax=Lentzea rhizosphaerae TaxID=2041025 RepID=A0ABV8C617_9PSEU